MGKWFSDLCSLIGISDFNCVSGFMGFDWKLQINGVCMAIHSQKSSTQYKGWPGSSWVNGNMIENMFEKCTWTEL